MPGVGSRGLRRCGFASVLCIGMLLGARAEGATIPLPDLLAPGFTLSLAGLSFSDFVLGTALGVDAADYGVEFFVAGPETGLRLTGPTVAANGNVAFVSLAYDVAADAPGAGLAQAALFANPNALGAGSLASVDVQLRALPTLLPLGALSAVTGAGVPSTGGSATLAGNPAALRIDTAAVSASAPGGAALVTLIEQRFLLSVAEPTALLLLASGALGIALLGSRRRRPDVRP